MIDFTKPSDAVAPQLLGAVLRHRGVALRITEVEAYLGADDPAAHSYRGRTPRNAAMFGPPGRLYVYLSYGIHHACNVVCAPEGTAHGCLLRAGEVLEGLNLARQRRGPAVPFARLASGPGNLGRAIGAELSDNGTPVKIVPADTRPEYCCGPRIGISRNAEARLRFWIPGHPTVTSPRWPREAHARAARGPRSSHAAATQQPQRKQIKQIPPDSTR